MFFYKLVFHNHGAQHVSKSAAFIGYTFYYIIKQYKLNIHMDAIRQFSTICNVFF